ncbi:hypothetical protein GK48_27780 [Salmonella enterica subsp. diarizonae]|nr:hypothetical protein [Salmonella enterica subsp. diarizonae]
MDQQDETQIRKTAETAYNAAQATHDMGEHQGYSECMDVAQKAADRAVSFDPANKDLLPGDLGKTAKPIEGFNMLGKGGSDSSGEADTKPTSGSNIK